MPGDFTLPDFLTAEEIDKAVALYAKCRWQGIAFAPVCERDIVAPVLDRINEALGQENSAGFLAYVIEYVLGLLPPADTKPRT